MKTNGFYVEIIPQNAPAERQTLAVGPTIVGRSAKSCRLVLDDPRISRVHLRINYDPDQGITVTDLYSANGSFFEGRALVPGMPIHWLVEQTVVVGDTRLILHYH